MFELKPISRNAIPEALAKAERYRLLNEPAQAESICHDVLRIDPDHQQALIMLLLAMTDQFEEGVAAAGAREIARRLQGEYERAYYLGIIAERQARAYIKSSRFGAGSKAYEGLTEAMRHYEQAESLRPPGNDDAILRWNTCARLLMRDSRLAPAPAPVAEPILSE